LLLLAVPFGSLARGSSGDSSTDLSFGAAEILVALLGMVWLARGVRRHAIAVRSGPVVVATGNLDLACALSDQLLVLDSGRLLRRGTPREVLDQPQSAQAARLLGYSNVFEATITGLDPGRNSSRLQLESAAGLFELAAPYLPGHFKGDRVSMAIRAEHVRVHAPGTAAPANAQPAQLVRVFQHVQFVRLEFAAGTFADLSPDEYARQKDNKSWQVEFPSEALRIL